MTFLQKLLCVGNGPVVIIDDEKKDRYIAKRCFEKSKLSTKHAFMEFADAFAFISYLESAALKGDQLPAMVLVDINMPSMNGFELLESVRKKSIFSKMPLLVIFSTSQNPNDIRKAEGLGASGYQVKPFSVEEYVTFFDSLD